MGLFGGPALALFKVASALALTKQVQALGVECVPVFWLASEDHDLAEVNQSLLLTPDLQLASFAAKTAGVEGAPVASIRFAEGTNEMVARAAELLGESLAADYLRESYTEGTSFSDAYAKLYTRLFGDYGLILLTPSDTDLHRIAAPLFADAARRSAELDEAILARNRELSSAGYHEQVKVTAESTPLFALVDGARIPIHRSNGQFKVGREIVSAEELQRRIEASPEQFSANVLLRPVLQDYWLPTLAYIGGPGGNRVLRAGCSGLRKAAWPGHANRFAHERDADRAPHRTPADEVPGGSAGNVSWRVRAAGLYRGALASARAEAELRVMRATR